MSHAQSFPVHLLLAFRRESRITPSMPILLTYLAAIIPTLCALPSLACIGATTLAVTISLAATGNRPRRLALLLLYLLGILWSRHALRGDSQAYHHLLTRDHCHISARIFIDGNPTPPGERGTSHPVSLRELKIRGHWQDCTGSVLAHVGPDTVLTHGQTYEVSGILSPAPQDGFGRHLLSQDIRHLLDVRELILLTPPRGLHRTLERFYRLRHHLGRLLTSGMSMSAGNLYQSMLLGRRDLFPRETKLHFLRSATLHIFAISGLHVMLVNTAFLHLLNCLGMGKFSRLTIGSLCSLTYIVLTGATPSSVRSGLMLLLSLVPQLLRRPSSIRHCLCLAALLELVSSPLCLFHCGFLFSFVIVAALIYSGPLMNSLHQLLLERWAWLPTCPQKRLTLKWPNYLWKGLSSLTIAWLASLPIAMHLNGIVSLGGLAIGVPAQGLATLLVFAAVPKLLLAMVFPPLSQLMGFLMDLGMNLLVALAEWGGDLSLCLLRPHAPASLAVLFLVAFFALICQGWRWPASRYCTSAILIAWIGLMLLPQTGSHALLAIAQGPEGGAPALCLIPTNHLGATVIAIGSGDSARLLYRRLETCGVKPPGNLCLSDLNGKLAGNLRFAAHRDLGTLALSQRQQSPSPEALDRLTASGTYVRREVPGSRKRQTFRLPQATLTLQKTPHGLQTTFREATLTLILSPVPDGQFLLIAQTPEDAVARLLPPASTGTFLLLPLRWSNPRCSMLY